MPNIAIVYGVFDADGYECKTLVGLFSTREKAEAFRGPYDTEHHGELRRWAQEDGREHPGKVTVEPLTMDAAVGCGCDEPERK